MPSIGQKYDAIARQFAANREKTLVEKKYLDAFLTQLPKNAAVLDVGCGTGEPILHYLMQQGCSVTGLDASKELLQIAKKNFPDAKFIFGDMRLVQIEEKFSGIIVWDSFFYLPREDQKHMLTRFTSWLEPNGKLLFTTGTIEGDTLETDVLGEKFSYYNFSPAEYQTMLESSGYEIVQCEENLEHHLVWLANQKGSCSLDVTEFKLAK